MPNTTSNIDGVRTTLQCPSCGTNLEITVAEVNNHCNVIESTPNGKYTRARQRFAALQEHGIDTSNYFCLTMPNGGEEVLMTSNENGLPIAVDDNLFASLTQEDIESDPILREIYENGYIKNTLLHRRWVMAQMMRMLNCTDWKGNPISYTEYINRYFGYRYAFKQMLDEVHVLTKLFESCDKRAYMERSKFFTVDVVADTCEKYVRDLRRYMESRPVYKYKKSNRNNNRYITLPGNKYVYLEDKAMIFSSLHLICRQIRECRSYRRLEALLRKFMKHEYVYPTWFKGEEKLPQKWKEAYKGAGAYYTLMNMIKFHDCFISRYEDEQRIGGQIAVNYLQEKLLVDGWEPFRFFALLKKTIEQNDFTLEKFEQNVKDSISERETSNSTETEETLVS